MGLSVIKVVFYSLSLLMTSEIEEKMENSVAIIKLVEVGNLLLCYHKLQWHFNDVFTNKQIFALNIFAVKVRNRVENAFEQLRRHLKGDD